MSRCRCGELYTSESLVHFEAIVPMYKSAHHIPNLLIYLDTLSDTTRGKLLVTFVIDGNIDMSYEKLINNLGNLERDWNWKIIQLSRNFGVGPALMAGLSDSESCVCVAFGADLQEPISIFKEFQEVLSNSDVHLALGVRRTRQDPLLSKLFSQIYWNLYRKFISPSTPKGGFDVCGISEKARKVLISLNEKNTNITAQMDWIGFSRQYIEFDRIARNFGKSTWSFGRKARLFFDSFYSFTDLPIRLMQILSVASLSILSILGLAVLISWMLGLIHIPGYTSIVFIQLFTSNVIIFCFSILAGYVTRTFDNTKNRPTFIVERTTKSI